jgi:hypothetical protein
MKFTASVFFALFFETTAFAAQPKEVGRSALEGINAACRDYIDG